MARPKGALRIAVEGCGHGTLDAIYASIEESCKVNGWDGVDLVIIGGDFQAVRNRQDLNVTAMPEKYRRMGDFHQYYYGKKVAPFLTIFVGGNHEASNHLFELYYGGWVAPNIYYLGAANVLQVGPLKIAGLSGIWHKSDSRKPHFERLPYTPSTIRSIYHVRELDARKLLAYRSQVDIGLSHDWPQGIEWYGDHKSLFKAKPFFRSDAERGELGNVAARKIMDRLRPPYWFSAHMHWKYTAFKSYEEGEIDDKHLVPSEQHNGGQAANGNTPHDSSNIESLKHRPRAFPIRSTDLSAVSAWNKFHVGAQKEEADESTKMLKETKARQEEAKRTGQPLQVAYAFEETYKEVQVDGINREIIDKKDTNVQPSQDSRSSGIPQVDGNFCSLPRKRLRESSPPQDVLIPSLTNQNDADVVPQLDGSALNANPVLNPDAIDIEMSDDEAEEDTAPLLDSTRNGKLSDIAPAIQNYTAPASESSVSYTTVSNTEGKKIMADGSVSEDMRAKLAALSDTFVKAESIDVSPSLPYPETITNKSTRFLALSKCESGKQFLQLMEIESCSFTGEVAQQPVKLSYDPEWLAILRVFAPELDLGGNSNSRTPQHRGDTYYRERIIEEETWILHNVVEKGLLQIPENFERTTSEDGSSSENEMPREVTNPQTSQFCKMIGIENLFDISEEERDHRMVTGVRNNNEYEKYQPHGGGRNRGSHRGGRRGYGRARGRW